MALAIRYGESDSFSLIKQSIIHQLAAPPSPHENKSASDGSGLRPWAWFPARAFASRAVSRGPGDASGGADAGGEWRIHTYLPPLPLDCPDWGSDWSCLRQVRGGGSRSPPTVNGRGC